MPRQCAPWPTAERPQIDELRAAIQANRVSFPVPVPIFTCQYRAEIQWRLVELYFVQGWSPDRLALRYHISSTRVRQSLRAWVRRAKVLGYLQSIPDAENLARIASALGQVRAFEAPPIPPAPLSNAFITPREPAAAHA